MPPGRARFPYTVGPPRRLIGILETFAAGRSGFNIITRTLTWVIWGSQDLDRRAVTHPFATGDDQCVPGSDPRGAVIG